jgi:N-acetylneuraminate synthase
MEAHHSSPLFIAEASSNHGRDLSRAKAFVDSAADAGCDAVKFQLFKIDRMFAPEILAQSPKHRARAEWELPLSHLEPLGEKFSAP